MSFKNVTTLVAELEQRYLECAICTNIFDEDVHVPLILPCHHTFCKACLRKIYNKDSIKCPTCNTVHQINRRSSNFPKDNIRRDLNSFLQLQSTTSLIKCHVCDSCCEIYLRCQQCNIYLCNICKHFHSLENSTHFLIQKSNENFQDVILDICSNPEHHSVPLIYYCESRSCQITLCPICAMENHRDPTQHDIYFLEDASKRQKVRLSESIHELKEKVEQSKQHVQFAVDSTASLEAHIKRLKSFKENEAKCDDILNKRIEEHSTRTYKLTEIKLKIQNFIENAQECIKLADQVHSELQPIKFLKIYQMIDKHIRGFINTSFHFEDFDVILLLDDDNRLLKSKLDEIPSALVKRLFSMKEKPKEIIGRILTKLAYKHWSNFTTVTMFCHNATRFILRSLQRLRKALKKQIRCHQSKRKTEAHEMPKRGNKLLLKKDTKSKIISKPSIKDVLEYFCLFSFVVYYDIQVQDMLLFFVLGVVLNLFGLIFKGAIHFLK